MQNNSSHSENGNSGSQRQPLADQLRPGRWDEFSGLDAIASPLIEQLKRGQGKPPSLIFWGPPGSGKTTLARIVGKAYKLPFVQFSAVLGGVKEVREIVAKAKESDAPTMLFVDEIHRFSKSQQDAFLPHVENGTIILFGATTENPSFYCTSALLSRVKVVVLPSISTEALREILQRGMQFLEISLTPEAKKTLVNYAAGDARRLLNALESFANGHKGQKELGETEIKEFLSDPSTVFYDKEGEEHYNVVSAFIKSMRGSNPDAALYWGFRMIEAGEDPRFVIRRMMIFASEDIGNADPAALRMAVATAEAFDRLGLPEGKIPIAHCITYLATVPKSNRSYMAMHKAIDAIKRTPKASVPLHLRNAPTRLMKDLSYGKDYQYPHEAEGGYVAGVQYLPDDLKAEVFYEPSERGREKVIKQLMQERKSGK